jgi:peptidoglycan hydrolase CwlO-like protein
LNLPLTVATKTMRAIVLLAAATGCTEAAKLQQSPVSQVVALIAGLKAKIEADGRKEQQSYDKYACWCENTLARKANSISEGKDTIDKLQKQIEKLKGDLGAHSAEIDQLKKDIAANLEAQKEAAEVRDKENSEFESGKNDNEQCTGALEAAIKVLTGAGTGKRGFLETMQETQLLSVVDGVRSVLRHESAVSSMSDKDLEVVKRFIASPETFVGGHAGVMSAAQIAANPFGDYAPQSTQIQGILKGMYDAFTGDIEKDNAEEAEKQKSFEELMATKKQEQETLETTLQKQEHDSSHKTKELADSKINQDDTRAQLKADEDFFEATKEGCKVKAGEWAERTRLRTEELTGIAKAIEILSDGQSTFDSSATTFIQIHSVTKTDLDSNLETHAVSQQYRRRAYNQLKELATKYQNTHMAELAVAVQSGGHFDNILAMIDEMVASLRKEEAEDIKHRDRCQNAQGKNGNDMADLNTNIEKAAAKLERLEDEEKELQNTIDALDADISKTKADMEELLEMRNDESDAFKKALKDDADAVALLEKAIVSLTQFYKNNKIPLALAQKEPEYSEDPDKAPDASFAKSYGGWKGESRGIVAILEMIKEDTANEIKTSRADDADAQKTYEKNRAKLQTSLDAQTQSKVQTEKELAAAEEQIADLEEAKNGKAADLAEEEKLKESIEKDCAWVEATFDSRREKRKAEMDGLVEAKNFLAGVEAGDDSELE